MGLHFLDNIDERGKPKSRPSWHRSQQRISQKQKLS